MKQDDNGIHPWAKDMVLVFQKGGPTLVSLICMGLLTWQVVTQVTTAVNALTVVVERNNTVMMKFMDSVIATHELQNRKLDALMKREGVSTSY